MLVHPFEPVYDSCSKILILGTFPSVKSREENFYYGHPHNHFWKVLSALTGCPLPRDIKEKKDLLLKEKIALWDVLKSCEIDASRDSSIRDPVANDLRPILANSSIEAIFTNGRKAGELYKRLCYPDTFIESHVLPSTSPANAQYTLERLIREWSIILK